MRYLLFLLAVVLAAPTAWAGCAPQDAGRMIGELARATNLLRGNLGNDSLPIDGDLNAAAQKHACDIASRQTISHTDRAGRLPMQRLRHAGYQACFSAENLAMGTLDANGTVAAWQYSPGHAKNQQTKKARAMGFGVARGRDGRLWWVGVYATACPKIAGTRRNFW